MHVDVGEGEEGGEEGGRDSIEFLGGYSILLRANKQIYFKYFMPRKILMKRKRLHLNSHCKFQIRCSSVTSISMNINSQQGDEKRKHCFLPDV